MFNNKSLKKENAALHERVKYLEERLDIENGSWNRLFDQTFRSESELRGIKKHLFDIIAQQREMYEERIARYIANLQGCQEALEENGHHHLIKTDCPRCGLGVSFCHPKETTPQETNETPSNEAHPHVITVNDSSFLVGNRPRSERES